MPPSLPASLRRMATGLRSSASTTPRSQTGPNSGSAQLPLPVARGVLPATWQQSTGSIGSTGCAPVGIGLINPAAEIATAADGDELKQAIYYEATE